MPFDFAGGYVGYLGYEAVRAINPSAVYEIRPIMLYLPGAALRAG